MAGIAEIALGAAPIAGGALLGVAAGTLKGPDFRGMIVKDMDLLERIRARWPQILGFAAGADRVSLPVVVRQLYRAGQVGRRRRPGCCTRGAPS